MKDMPGYEGKYAITEDGRIWAYPNRYNGYKGHWKKQYMRNKHIRSDGSIARYSFVSLGRKTHMIHRLVAKTYLDTCSDKCQINHKDGDGTNNHISNLEWCNNYENFTHAKRIGLWSSTSGLQPEQRKINGRLTGSVNGKKFRRKFTISEANNIRNIWLYGHISRRRIAKAYKCSSKTIDNICNNLTYKD